MRCRTDSRLESFRARTVSKGLTSRRQGPIDEQVDSEDGNSALSDEDAYQAAADAEDEEVLGSDSDGGREFVEPAPASSKKAAKRAKAAARAEAEAEAAAAARAEVRAERAAGHRELQTYQSQEERLVRLPWDYDLIDPFMHTRWSRFLNMPYMVRSNLVRSNLVSSTIEFRLAEIEPCDVHRMRMPPVQGPLPPKLTAVRVHAFYHPIWMTLNCRLAGSENRQRRCHVRVAACGGLCRRR